MLLHHQHHLHPFLWLITVGAGTVTITLGRTLPLEQLLVQVHYRRKGWLFFSFFLTKGVLFHFLCGRPFYFNKILLKKTASGLSFYLM